MLSSFEYSVKVQQRIHNLKEQEQLCDCKLVAEDGNSFMVHSLIMAASCDYIYIKKMGGTNMQETDRGEFNLRNISAIGLKAIIDFAYSGTLNVELETLFEVAAAASFLKAVTALELCCQFIKDTVVAHNFLQLLRVADIFSLNEGRKSVMDFLLVNINSVSKSAQFLHLQESHLVELFRSNELKTESEYALWIAAMRWLHFDVPGRTPIIIRVLEHVRFPLMTANQLARIDTESTLRQANEDYARLIEEAMHYQQMPRQQPLLQSPRTQVRAKHQVFVSSYENHTSAEKECLWRVLDVQRYGFKMEHSSQLYPADQRYGTFCTADNFLYVTGGYMSSSIRYCGTRGSAVKYCSRYDPRFNCWMKLPPMRYVRAKHAAIVYEQRIFVVGGVKTCNKYRNDCEVFSLVSFKWEKCAPLKEATRTPAVAIFNGTLYLSGGTTNDGYASNKIYTYNFTADLWEEKPPMLGYRTMHQMFPVGNYLYFVGGEVERISNLYIERYNPVTGESILCPTQLPYVGHVACCFGGKFYIMGGTRNQHILHQDIVLIYDVDAETFSEANCDKEGIVAPCEHWTTCLLTFPQAMF